jgi:hypothetical protein
MSQLAAVNKAVSQSPWTQHGILVDKHQTTAVSRQLISKEIGSSGEFEP